VGEDLYGDNLGPTAVEKRLEKNRPGRLLRSIVIHERAKKSIPRHVSTAALARPFQETRHFFRLRMYFTKSAICASDSLPSYFGILPFPFLTMLANSESDCF
jgi:hypothetical protein